MSDGFALKWAADKLDEIRDQIGRDLSLDEWAAIACTAQGKVVDLIHELPRLNDAPYERYIDERTEEADKS